MENDEKKIICFIAPQKFASLLGVKKASAIGFIRDGAYLNDSEHLAYIDMNGVMKTGSFKLEDFKSASVVLIPDSFMLNYLPDFSFKIIYHSQTDFNLQILNLANRPGCLCITKSSEDENDEHGKNTVYQKIADFIGGAFQFEDLWEYIPIYDFELESKLELLHNCLLIDSAKTQELPQILSSHNQYRLAFEDFQSLPWDNNNHLEKLIKFRDVLLD